MTADALTRAGLPRAVLSCPHAPGLRRALALAVALALPLAAHAEAPADANPTTLDGLEVTARRQSQADSYTLPVSRAAIGLDLSVRQTPQSVTSVTRQQMDDLQIESIDDVLTSTTGITTYSLDNAGRTTFRARGFDIGNFKVDGMLVNGASSFSGGGAALNMDLYDHVQVVRGANGLLGGTGDPSATVYLERKRPTADFGGAAALTLGSHDKRRLMGDVNVPLTADGRVRSRFVVSAEDSDTFRQREDIQRLAGLASFEADLGSATVLNLGVQYEKTRNGGASWGSNVPIWWADGSRAQLSRSTNPAADWSLAKRDNTTVFGSVEQGLGADWTLRVAFAHDSGESFTNYGVAKVNNAARNQGFAGFWNPDGSGAFLNAIHSESETRRDNLDISASGPLQLFGREHQLMVGFNGYRSEITDYSFSAALGNCTIAGVAPWSGCQYRAVGLPIADWRSWDGSYAGFETFRTPARSKTITENLGGYLAGRFSLADPLSLVLGTRLSNYKTYTQTYTQADVRTRGAASGEQQVVTPYAGLVWDFAANYSAYVSYTDVFSPQGNVRDANDTLLDPVTGKSYEAGIKGEWADGALNAALALFRNDQNIVGESTGEVHPDTGLTIYRAVDGVKSKGADLEISGRLAQGWNVYAGYTWLQVDGLSYQQDPRHLLRLNTTWTLPGALSKLTVGGGLSVQSGTVMSTNPGRPLGGGRYDASNLPMGGYTLVNLMARYALTDTVQLAVNVNNLTDKTYYTQYGFYDGLIFGEPRSTTFSVRARF